MFSLFGAALVSASTGSDAGGITAYTAIGARFGSGLVWVLILLAPPLVVVQLLAMRMGAVTGKGLTDLIREELPLPWTVGVLLALIVANAGIVVSEFAGVAAAFALFGVPRIVAVPPAAALLWFLVANGSYRRVERLLLTMGFTVLAYPLAAALAHPDWGQVGRDIVYPSIQVNGPYLAGVLAIIGTTLSPYLLLYSQSAVAERGVSPRAFGTTRAEVILGTFCSTLVAASIMVAAATLRGTASLPDLTQGALIPVTGGLTRVVFAVGLLGASFLTAGLLPLATAFALGEALGFERRIEHGWRDAPVFVALFTALLGFGAAVTLVPGLPLVLIIFVGQLANALALPVVLVTMLRLAADRVVMGDERAPPLVIAIGGTVVLAVTFVALAALVVAFTPG